MTEQNMNLEDVAQKISSFLSEKGIQKEINEDITAELKENLAIGEFNLYPSLEKTACHPLAIFIQKRAIYGETKKKYNKTSYLLGSLVQHAQGYCIGQSQNIVVLLKKYSTEDFSHWLANIKEIQKTANVEFYLDLGAGNVSKVNI